MDVKERIRMSNALNVAYRHINAKVEVCAKDNKSYALVSSIEIPASSVATDLAAHAKDKMAKIQKKTKIHLDHTIIRDENNEDVFISRLSADSQNALDVDVLAAEADALTDLHRNLITAALLPTVTSNILADLKPLGHEVEN